MKITDDMVATAMDALRGHDRGGDLAVADVRELLEAGLAAAPQAAEPSDNGALWSFLCSVLRQGADIWLDHRERSTDEYHARIDVAAHERVDALREALGDEK